MKPTKEQIEQATEAIELMDKAADLLDKSGLTTHSSRLLSLLAEIVEEVEEAEKNGGIVKVIDPDERLKASQIGGKIEKMMKKDKNLKEVVVNFEDETWVVLYKGNIPPTEPELRSYLVKDGYTF